MKIVLKLIYHFSRSIVLNFVKLNYVDVLIRLTKIFNFTTGAKYLYYRAATHGGYTRIVSIEDKFIIKPINYYGNILNLSNLIKEIKS